MEQQVPEAPTLFNLHSIYQKCISDVTSQLFHNMPDAQKLILQAKLSERWQQSLKHFGNSIESIDEVNDDNITPTAEDKSEQGDKGKEDNNLPILPPPQEEATVVSEQALPSQHSFGAPAPFMHISDTKPVPENNAAAAEQVATKRQSAAVPLPAKRARIIDSQPTTTTTTSIVSRLHTCDDNRSELDSEDDDSEDEEPYDEYVDEPTSVLMSHYTSFRNVKKIRAFKFRLGILQMLLPIKSPVASQRVFVKHNGKYKPAKVIDGLQVLVNDEEAASIVEGVWEIKEVFFTHGEGSFQGTI